MPNNETFRTHRYEHVNMHENEPVSPSPTKERNSFIMIHHLNMHFLPIFIAQKLTGFSKHNHNHTSHCLEGTTIQDLVTNQIQKIISRLTKLSLCADCKATNSKNNY